MGSRVITHSGSNNMYYSVIYFLPDEDITILFSTNVSDRYDFITWIADKIKKMVFEADYIPTPIEQAPYVLSKQYAAEVNGQNVESFLSKMQLKLKVQLRDPGVLNGLGYWHMDLGDNDWAMSLFKLNTKLHPKNGNTWDSLGEAYVTSNQYELAKKSLELALSLATNKDCEWCEN
jgi:tetratricopeptide (TPR) repeat protein